MRDRRAGLLASVAAGVIERRDIPGGFAYRFEADAQALRELIEMIDLERQCCRFLRFLLQVEPSDGPVWLELTGPAGTRHFLPDLLA